MLFRSPTLKTEEDTLKQQKATMKDATKEQKEAYHQQKEAFKKDLRAAELAIDSTLAPIFAKLDAAHQGRHHSST